MLSEKCVSLLEKINKAEISNWSDIDSFLSNLKNSVSNPKLNKKEFHELLQNGTAFITYDFGIDGVSIEIQKYARCLEDILGKVPMHFIGGDFHDKADIVLDEDWNRFEIKGINGWDKWYDGKWFSKLYYEDMPEGSEISDDVAKEIWNQAANFAEKLGTYLAENEVSLLIPVNIPTNPGNFAIQLAIIMLTEGLGTYVISSNHDFYWEGGKAASKREKNNEPKGPRDHFFKNMDNKPFFELFTKMYPWDGDNWIQVNINSPQTKELIEKFGFKTEKVFELGTGISDKFFEEFNYDDQRLIRKKMAYILSDGSETIKPTAIKSHLENLSYWMKNQKPIACACREGLEFDPSKEKTVYCLQPTRVIARKRIEMDLKLLTALFKNEKFRSKFEADDYQLVFHITGPVPIEHQEDLETVLNAYIDLCDSLPANFAEKVFIAMSVGTEDHPAFAEKNLEPLCIEDIYKLATIILFPSETEGRGLPIIESSAEGIPIVCSRYYPEDVFAEVVGEKLSEEEQIKYNLFPENGFTDELLDKVYELIMEPEKFEKIKKHNKHAVSLRYGTEMIKKKFEDFFDSLIK